MKRIFVSPFAVAVLWGVSLAQQPTSPPSNNSTPQEQQAPATTTPSTQPNGQPAEPTPQAPQQTPQPGHLAAQQNPKSPSGNSPQSASASRIAPGTVIPVELTKSIDAKKVKTGDEVVAKVTMDLKTNSGEIVVPKDTKVVGHVTEAQTRSKEQKDSQVGIIFDRAVMKSGEIEMPMSIQAIIAPQGSNSGNANNGRQPPALAEAERLRTADVHREWAVHRLQRATLPRAAILRLTIQAQRVRTNPSPGKQREWLDYGT